MTEERLPPAPAWMFVFVVVLLVAVITLLFVGPTGLAGAVGGFGGAFIGWFRLKKWRETRH